MERVDAHAEGPECAARGYTLAGFSVIAAGAIEALCPDSFDRTFRVSKVAEIVQRDRTRQFAHLGAAVGQYRRRFEIMVQCHGGLLSSWLLKAVAGVRPAAGS